ncbi:MAG: hypothetical protein J6Y82_12765 [Bacteroidales bacterium]|nr:hypothetical protein [Bacteroidales bacterium]
MADLELNIKNLNGGKPRWELLKEPKPKIWIKPDLGTKDILDLVLIEKTLKSELQNIEAEISETASSKESELAMAVMCCCRMYVCMPDSFECCC